MTQRLRTHNLGFPRIGANRELKRSLEAYWAGRIDETQLRADAQAVRAQNWRIQQAAGIDWIPSNDFSLYDGMLDMTVLLGAVPERFGGENAPADLKTYFGMARGGDETPCPCGGAPKTAMEMTKWFDTNYHYLVPELREDQSFRLAGTKPFDEFSEALALGIRTVPVLVGPVSFLRLSKPRGKAFATLSLLPRLLPVYGEILRRLRDLGAQWVQLDEPALCLDLDAGERFALLETYGRLRAEAPGLRLMAAAYFGALEDNADTARALAVDALHVDGVRGAHELEKLLEGWPADKQLSLGVVDGRNIWRNDFEASLRLLRRASQALGHERVAVAPSCSLLHVPVSVRAERRLDAAIKNWLAFAEEKLAEVCELARQAAAPDPATPAWAENRAAMHARRASALIHDPQVKARAAAVSPDDLRRASAFERRHTLQQLRLQLPPLPTTTIGSFPQTDEVRTARARFKTGALNRADYETFLKTQIAECVWWQASAGIDVLVHGEFERNDMVEYFGERLKGFAFTENGWVQSYGSRCVKPPVIFGDVSRPKPMTLEWTRHALSLTRKPMKGMLTGPITILQWSFVRDDQTRAQTAAQIALALRDEVRDLEEAGVPIIQIDEPALREGLPLRRAQWENYLAWAVDAFRLAACGVRDETQIHTHMCYCEFEDILESIAALDADVISIEASRSNMALLESFGRFRYPNDIGPGVWDIHSPRVPSAEEMRDLILAAARVIPKERLWVNPDCGLKTRRWEEVKPALTNLVKAARLARAQLS